MKKFFLVGIMLLLAGYAFAQERITFFDRYDPTATMVYSQVESPTATGDQVAVNTYVQKTIQVSPIQVGEYVYISIEGRLKDQVNTPNWAVLDTVEFGVASADTSKNKIVDVTEYVDFLRVGIIRTGTNGASKIDIKGIFDNLNR